MLNLPIVGSTNGNDITSTRRFGVFELDLRAGELRRNGIKVKLQEQPFQVLTELLERPGQVVTREELRNRLWPADTYVDFDHSLNAAIRRLRDTLGDSAENPTFVETVARRGYRFLAPVSAGPANGDHAGQGELAAVVPITAPRRHHWWVIGAVVAVALVLIGLAVGFFLAPRPPALGHITRLTANPAGDPVRTAAISRDGHHLAFADETGFYLRQIDTGETHPIALPEEMSATAISWAPDNDHMIVALAATNRRPSLWDISVLGGSARRLVDDGSQPAISPNGKQIAFVAGQPLHQRIWLAGLNGEPPRELLGEDGDLFGTITWSPDGTKIAYTTAKFTYGYGAKGMIAVADLSHPPIADGRLRPTIVLSLTGLDASMAWTPDGRLVYTLAESRPRQEDSNLWWIRLNGQLQPAAAPVRLTNDQGAVFGVSASGDSKRIAYIKGIPQPDVYVAKLQPSGALEEPQRLTLDDRQDLPYDWTTDNKSVIFVSDRTGSFSIYKQPINQTVPELLMTSNQQLVQPRLSPDGTQVLYLVNPNRAEADFEVPLMIAPLAGGASREIAKAKWISNHQCARAPATVCIYSVNTDAGVTFFRFDPSQGQGTQIFQLKDDLAQLFNWSLSPDGTMLAIAKGKWGNVEPRISLFSLNGAPERSLTIRGWPGIMALDWAADSKSLWATTPGDKENTLLRIDLQGNARAVWHPKNVTVNWAIPSRDGKYLALHVHSSSANVSMLEQ
ncbi:MAG: winged helix-turn-helix domain-containing protein [Acidobacteriia bacterium]|nr:winged helix-turn-helix domain-containing protein [Terriglobia bacterium]